MFAINLTHHQVMNIVNWLVEAERHANDADSTNKAYYEGKSVAYLDILREFYTSKEIAVMKKDVIKSYKGRG